MIMAQNLFPTQNSKMDYGPNDVNSDFFDGYLDHLNRLKHRSCLEQLDMGPLDSGLVVCLELTSFGP